MFAFNISCYAQDLVQKRTDSLFFCKKIVGNKVVDFKLFFESTSSVKYNLSMVHNLNYRDSSV